MLLLGSGRKVRPRVRVIGVGGAGCNAVAESTFERLVIGTPLDLNGGAWTTVSLTEDDVASIVTTEPRTLTSLRAGWYQKVDEFVTDADLVYIFAGLGGRVGSHLTPVLASLCRQHAQIVVTSVTLPFSVESSSRMELALKALESKTQRSDNTITFPNDHLLRLAPDLPLRRAFGVMDRIMTVTHMELERVLTVDDLKNLRQDFPLGSQVRFGYGSAEGRNRERVALQEALRSPWFDFPLEMVTAGIALIYADDLDDLDHRLIATMLGRIMPLARIRFAARDGEGGKFRIVLLLGYSQVP